MLNLFNKIPIFEDYYMYQAPLTPEEEDEYVYNQGSAQLVITHYPKNISVKVRKCPFCLTRNYMGLSNGAL